MFMSQSRSPKNKTRKPRLSHSLVDDKKKVLDITYGSETVRFQLKVKRAFSVLLALLRKYPRYMNIHDLDGIFHDPNRALSSLRLEDGFAPFIETKSIRNVTHVKLNIDRLFSTINKDTDVIKLWPEDNRISISRDLQQLIYEKFEGKCNITGIELLRDSEALPKHTFLKNYLIATYDHRQPLSKGGSNQEHNFQLVSRTINQEKNQICNVCTDSMCAICALAHPEKSTLIYPTQQDVSALRK